MKLIILHLLLCVVISSISAKSPPQCCLPHSKGITTGEAFYMFTYNKEIFECIPFIYSGSGGNDNRFWSKRDCEETCLASVET